MSLSTHAVVTRAADGARLDDEAALALAAHDDAPALVRAAARLRDAAFGDRITYSRKVFLPLTRLCRDVCRYCTFATTPRNAGDAYLSIERMVAIAQAGRDAGCTEALFTLGDKPELRYRAAREALAALGHDTTVGYLAEAARRVHEASGLLPHVNPGVMTGDEIDRLRPVSVSMGMMLESTAARLGERGGPHHGSPDKDPAVRLATLDAAGARAVPFTTGLLIGIGETRRERIETLLAIRAAHERHGQVQEVIVQNFRAKDDTPMAGAPEPTLDDLVWTIAVARLVLGAGVSVQAPPNLSPGVLERLVGAGIDDWGGVSPVTPDHVNPEAPWPHLDALAAATRAAGKELVQRLPLYPPYTRDLARWVDRDLHAATLRAMDASGLARADAWAPGERAATPAVRVRHAGSLPPALARGLDAARAGRGLGEGDVVRLLEARGAEVDAVCAAADRLRAETSGDAVGYVVNRNVNYTNVCYFKCRFCAFSKGRLSANLRGSPYDLALDEIARRVEEAWARGATEVCMQGGIHPEYTGETYLRILRAVKEAVPDIHVHAFSPLEVWQGAATLGIGLGEYLARVRDAGLGSLPGTAAEILDDEVRAILCPDKLTTAQWLEVMETAHGLGLRSTATMMFGHVDAPRHQARHLLRVRALAARTGGFTEFVPLPFVAPEAPIYLRGRARRGPTYREALLVHAVARLVLHPHVANVQTSWVKMGEAGARACLEAGANDLGGTLMNESITRAAGAAHGEELPPARMEAIARGLGRTPRQRTTLYADADPARRERAFAAADLAPVVDTPARAYERPAGGRVLVRPGLEQGTPS